MSQFVIVIEKPSGDAYITPAGGVTRKQSEARRFNSFEAASQVADDLPAFQRRRSFVTDAG